MKIVKANRNHPDFIGLCEELENTYAEVVGLHRHPNEDSRKDMEKIQQVYLFYFGEEIAGCVAISGCANEVVEVSHLYVLPKFRGHGISLKLLWAAEQDAKAMGAKTLVLETYEQLTEAEGLFNGVHYEVTKVSMKKII